MRRPLLRAVAGLPDRRDPTRGITRSVDRARHPRTLLRWKSWSAPAAWAASIRGRHQVINRSVALKFLAPKHARDDNSRQRFLREARAVNRVQHEHIIDVSDFGETEDGLVYMVMEFLSGRTLAEDIAQGPMSLTRACRIGLQLSLALGRAHELGVIHRDIKPANVFLIRKGHQTDFVKLLDFGLARAQDDVALTKSNLLLRYARGYMAPEQAEQRAGRSEGRSVRAGLCHWAFRDDEITGRLPFRRRADRASSTSTCTSPPPRPKQQLRPQNCRRPSRPWCCGCWDKDPERRPGECVRSCRRDHAPLATAAGHPGAAAQVPVRARACAARRRPAKYKTKKIAGRATCSRCKRASPSAIATPIHRAR